MYRVLGLALRVKVYMGFQGMASSKAWRKAGHVPKRCRLVTAKAFLGGVLAVKILMFRV